MNGLTLAQADEPRRTPTAPPRLTRRRSASRLLLRRGHAEWRVTRPARLAPEVLRHRLGGGQVLGAGGVSQLLRLRAVVLHGCFELRPFLPDLRLRLGLVGERALREERHDLVRE